MDLIPGGHADTIQTWIQAPTQAPAGAASVIHGSSLLQHEAMRSVKARPGYTFSYYPSQPESGYYNSRLDPQEKIYIAAMARSSSFLLVFNIIDTESLQHSFHIFFPSSSPPTEAFVVKTIARSS